MHAQDKKCRSGGNEGFKVLIGRLTAQFLKNTGRLRPALTLYHECVDVLKFLPPCKTVLDVKALIYQDISGLYDSLDDLKEAIKYMEMAAVIGKAQSDTDSHAWTLSKLGDLYLLRGDFKKGIQSLEQALVLAKDTNVKAVLYCELASVHKSIGNTLKATECIREGMRIMKEAGKEATTVSTIFGSESIQPLSNPIPFYEDELKKCRQAGNKHLELLLCGRLGDAYLDVKNDPKTAIEYFQLWLSVAKDLGYTEIQSMAHFRISMIFSDLEDFEESRKHQEMGSAMSAGLQSHPNKIGNWYNAGVNYLRSGNVKKAIIATEQALKYCEKVDELLENEHDLKVDIGDTYQHVYNIHSLALVVDNQEMRALLNAEKGRTKALAQMMRSNYGIPTKTVKKLSATGIQQLARNGATGTFFVSSSYEPFTFVWLIAPDGTITLKRLPLPKRKVKNYIKSMVDRSYSQIGVQIDPKCEDRSLPHRSSEHAEPNLESTQATLRSSEERLWEATNTNAFVSSNSMGSAEPGAPTETLDEFINASLSDLLDNANKEEKPEELIFAAHGSLCLAPFAAIQTPDGSCLIDKFRIRVIPSLTTLNHILSSPDGYHSNTGALIVGDPNVGVPNIGRLPYAKREVEMIGKLLKVEPLTGDKATKEEVLKRMGSVSLVHLASHGDSERGEIALAPNPAARSGVLQEKDFLLSMADVLNAKLRAKLVVLSCCHSGRGDIKAEGVIGIARAFLAAGARAILASLWAIDDEATLYFMQRFYKGIVRGKSASAALHQATKEMKNSETFRETKYWAPFQLIGDDVHIDKL